MIKIVSFASRLRQQLQNIGERMMDLLDISTVHLRGDPDGPFVITGVPYSFGEANADQEELQTEIKDAYSAWFEQFSLLFHNTPRAIQKRIDETKESVMKWIEQQVSWDIQATIEECKTKFRERIRVFYELIPNQPDVPELIVVPDTNALIKAPEPSHYSQVVGQNKYEFILIPTVVKELGDLEKRTVDNEFREKLRSVNRRMKGWRRQGYLQNGVTDNKTVTVRTVAKEPKVSQTLSWLDASNNDDRIVASVLEIQRLRPSAIVVLVTADNILQTKAELANLPYLEPPKQR